jgi:hypothetical protein
MLRLVLLVLYLMGSSSASPQAKQGNGIDLFGLQIFPGTPATASTADAGAGYDPDGLQAPAADSTGDAGAGYDPNGAR